MSEEHNHHADPILLDFFQKQNDLEKVYGLGQFERYDLDSNNAELVFKNQGIVCVTAKIQILGTLSTSKNTWLWSWDNPSIPEHLKHQTPPLQEHFNDINFLPLAEDILEDNDQRIIEAMAIATHILQSKGVYKHYGDTHVIFMAIDEIQRKL
jgi:hypothetical protein